MFLYLFIIFSLNIMGVSDDDELVLFRIEFRPGEDKFVMNSYDPDAGWGIGVRFASGF